MAIGQTLQFIGRTYDHQGDYSPALQYYFESLKIHKAIGELKGQASTLSLIGVTYKNQEHLEEALSYHRQAYQVIQKVGDPKQTSIILNNIGVAYRHMKQYDQALEHHKRALAIDEQLGDKYGMSICHNCLGVVYKLMGEPYKAIEYYRLGKQLSEEGGNRLGVTVSSLYLAEVYIDLNDLEQAYQYASVGLEVAQQLAAKRRIKEAALTLSGIEEKRGNTKGALQYYKLYSAYKDSLFNEQSSQQIAEMQTRYESDKQQLEIASLTKDKLRQEEENRIQRYIAYGLAIFAFVLISLSVLLIKNMKAKARAFQLLSAQKREIDEKNDELKSINEELTNTLDLVARQKQDIEVQNNSIMASISCAKRIQSAMLPLETEIKRHLPDSFILFKPKDVVSGDFYWFANINGLTILAAADCTGHGVPGAFMSLIGNDLLNNIVLNQLISSPEQILDALHEGVRNALRQHESDSREGMDIAICCIDHLQREVLYAGAMNPLYYAHSGEELCEIKADKISLGGDGFRKQRSSYTLHRIDISKPTTFYLCSDGFQDQFGGERNKKYMSKRFRELLYSASLYPMAQQQALLENELQQWMGNNRQVDDILVVAFAV
jgi:serine phosphatase RsbU (regulator of sigma subunit)